jgi:hypothetical protein
MSVLTYVYPRDPERLALNSVLDSLERESGGFVVEECENRPRTIPNWSYLLLSHQSHKHLRFEFVVAENNKSNVKWLAEHYSNNRNFDVVCLAKKYIWSKIRIGKASDRELTAGFRSHDFIIWHLIRLSAGVVDLPEDGKLYSCSGFARFKNAKQRAPAPSA